MGEVAQAAHCIPHLQMAVLCFGSVSVGMRKGDEKRGMRDKAIPKAFPLRPLTNPSHDITHALNWRPGFLDPFSELRCPRGDFPTQPEKSQGLHISPQRLSDLGTYYPSKYNKFSISQGKINSA